MNQSEQPGCFEAYDLLSSAEFLERPLQQRDDDKVLTLVKRIHDLFPGEPAALFRECVAAACQICDADLAGVTVERPSTDGTAMLYGAAISGAGDASAEHLLAQMSAPCRRAMSERRPQGIRQTREALNQENGKAEVIREGMFVPWNSGEQPAVLWVLTRKSARQFNLEDYRFLRLVAELASTAYGQLRTLDTMVRQASGIAANAMAHTLAHRINNPLQSITNSMFLAMHSQEETSRLEYVTQASREVRDLAKLVGELLLLHRPIDQGDTAAGSAVSQQRSNGTYDLRGPAHGC